MLQKVCTNLEVTKEQNSKILAQQAFIKEQNVQILNYLQSQQRSAIQTYELPEDMPVELPLQNEDAVQQLENFLLEKDRINALVCYNLKRKIGNNYKQSDFIGIIFINFRWC